MGIFHEVFKPDTIYNIVFINVKGVLEYQTLDELQEKEPLMYNRWEYISETKYSMMLNKAVTGEMGQITYAKHAVLFPEFTKIVAISYGTIYLDEGKQKRFLKTIVNDDEPIVIETFMDVLNGLGANGNKSFPIVCGHNLLAHDLPFLIKRFLVNHNKFNSVKKIPVILKRALDTKPWESGVIDTVNVWKFNGYTHGTPMLIADFLGMERNIDLMSHTNLSSYYWRNINVDAEKTLKTIELQAATQTNLTMRLLKTLRDF